MILVILALMGATGTVRIRRSRPEGFARGTRAVMQNSADLQARSEAPLAFAPDCRDLPQPPV